MVESEDEEFRAQHIVVASATETEELELTFLLIPSAEDQLLYD